MNLFIAEEFEKGSLTYLAYRNSFNSKNDEIQYETRKYKYYLENIQKLNPNYNKISFYVLLKVSISVFYVFIHTES